MHRPFDIGCYIGRFQHIHAGHEFAINTGLKVCDRMLVMVGSSQEQGTVRNPFPVSTRIRMIQEIYGPEVIVAALPDFSHAEDICAEWGRHVLDNIYQIIRKVPDIFIYGNDERRSEWFREQIHEVREVTEMIVARERLDISATQMREWLFLDNHSKWAKYANPKLHKHYDELRAELIAAPGLANHVQTHLKPAPRGWSDKETSIF